MTRIKQMRIKSGKTQQEIAELLCINRTTYTKWENGTHSPDVSSLQSLAHILNTTVAYLLEESDIPDLEAKKEPVSKKDDGLSDIQRENIELLKKLTSDQALRLNGYLQGLLDRH